MRFVNLLLLVIALTLQLRIWAGEGSLAASWQLRQAVAAQAAENERLATRNQRLAAEVHDLKTGLETMEATARRELGMVGEGETFYHVVRP